MLAYLANAERLDCINYLEDRYQGAVDGIKAIHAAFVYHRDIYPKNMEPCNTQQLPRSNCRPAMYLGAV